MESVGVVKYVPAPEVLATAYRRAVQRAVLQQAINNALRNMTDTESIEVPEGLTATVQNAIEGTGRSWDDAISGIADTRFDY